MIPGNAPPTIECTYGSVTWRLRGQVHRPGTFSHKLSASREVILIASPGEDDTEDSENIIVERQWDSQLQYLISISGRSFYIGGTLPIQITMLPMSKMKIHRISVILEGVYFTGLLICVRTDYLDTPLERTDYYNKMQRLARTDPIQRISLLSLKMDGKDSRHILPLISDDPEAFKRSPFYTILGPDDDPSAVAASLMGPGPWMIQHELKLPTSCAELHFSNKNRRANMLITHALKVVFRVERGDDEWVDMKTGKRKLFDIVVQSPVHILSVCTFDVNNLWSAQPLFRPARVSVIATRTEHVSLYTPNRSLTSLKTHRALAHVASSIDRAQRSASLEIRMPVGHLTDLTGYLHGSPLTPLRRWRPRPSTGRICLP
jgi:hypothetical protein